jgi:hypothetical protein
MNVLKHSSDFLTRLSQPFAAKDDAQGRRRALVSAVILAIALALYGWLYL